MKWKLWIGVGVAVVAASGVTAYFLRNGKEEVKFRYAKLDKGSIRQRVSATGQLSAVVQVNVGTQVSGMITMINADYNSIVKKGQVIAQVDPTTWEQGVKDSESSLQRSQANYDDAKRQLERNQRLFQAKLVSEQDLDAKKMAFETARAQLESSKINLEKAKVNLDYCTIKAPVDGVVVSRLADVGQTVAASYSTPNLFVIAQDLSRMKLEVSVDEADIAQLKVGQTASFTVDSIVDTQFRGRVTQVRLEPVVQQNVVNYKVVVEVDNQTQEQVAAQKEQRAAMMGGGPGMAAAPEQGQPAASPASKPAETAKPKERRAEGPRGEGAGPMGRMGEGPMDLNAMWERAKDRIQEREPGVTKEAWMARMKERMAQWQKQGGPGGPEAAKPASRKLTAVNQAKDPGGIIKVGGPFYGGEYVLRPGMTANVTIVTNQVEDVFRVPNGALRFNPMTFLQDPNQKPAAGQAQAGGGRQGGGGGFGGFGGFGGGQDDRKARMADRGFMARREDRIWILENGKPKAVPVKAGLTDGQYTQVSGEGLVEGMQFMVGVEETKKPAAAAATGGSPFGGPGMRR